MKVSDAAKRAGVSASAIRFYEAQGVLPAARRGPSGYREYHEHDLCRLRMVVSLRALGIALQTAGRVARECDEGMCDGGTCGELAADLLPLIADRRDAVARERLALERLDAELARLERSLTAGGSPAHLCVVEGVADVRTDSTD